MEEDVSSAMSTPAMLFRFAIMVLGSSLLGIVAANTVLEAHQAIACSVFLAIILGPLFFWGFRLAIARGVACMLAQAIST